MASATLRASRWLPRGTTFAVYLRSHRRDGSAPSGSAVLSGQVMGNSTVDVTGLAEETDYVAYWLDGSSHQYVEFGTRTTPRSLPAIDEDLRTVESGSDAHQTLAASFALTGAL